jgi:hypothetical protein
MSAPEIELGGSFVPSQAAEVPTGAAEAVPAQSPAVQRFRTCRWRKAAESGVPDHCTHRDVQPMAGTAGFAPEAWCADCNFFKVRRIPRKRPEPTPDDRYYY